MICHGYDLVVAGGGAAGFFGAICAAEYLAERQDVRILLLEKGAHLLSKVRISGGGRCNLTHASFEPRTLAAYYPRGGKELLGPFHYFQPGDTIHWFEKNGVKLKTEEDGRIFPASNTSQTVIDCLKSRAKEFNIEFKTRTGVQAIERDSRNLSDYKILCTNGEAFHTKFVLLAPGGGSASAYSIARKLGHSVIEPVPSLFSFAISDPRLEGLSGISIPSVSLTLPVVQDRHTRQRGTQSHGAVLITHQGLSGPAVLQLSAWGARFLAETQYKTLLQVNWVPDHSRESLHELLKDTRSLSLGLVVNTCPGGILPQRLWKKLAAAALAQGGSEGAAEIDTTWQNASNRILDLMIEQLTNCRFDILGRNVNKEEFVTAGGISLREVDFRTMESRLYPGLFFAGEYLDIDGLTGGFNFQAAWTTGWLAGRAIAAKIEAQKTASFQN